MAEKFTAGYYVGFIQSWALGQSKEKGTPEFSIVFIPEYKKGPGGTKEDCPQEKRTIYRYITDKTIDYFVADLKALGYDRDQFDDLDPNSPNAFNFEGAEIEARCKFEDYKGESKEKWELALVKNVAKPMEEGGVANLNALFGGAMKSLVGNKKAMPAASSGYGAKDGNTANTGTKDDIPF